MNGRYNIPLFILFLLFSTGCTNYDINNDYVKPIEDSFLPDLPDSIEPEQNSQDYQEIPAEEADLAEDSSSVNGEIPDNETDLAEDSSSVDWEIPDNETNLAGDAPAMDLEAGTLTENIAAPPENQTNTNPDESYKTRPLSENLPSESLPDYGRCVDRTGGSEITLYWEHPLLNVDGSPLVNLVGYRVFYGKLSGTFSKSLDVGPNTNPTIYNLDPGIWYFRVKVYNTEGLESNFSNETCAAL